MTQIEGFSLPNGTTFKVCTKKSIGNNGELVAIGGFEFFSPTLGDYTLIIPGAITLPEAAKIASQWFAERGHLKTKT